MKQTRFTEAQIVGILQEADAQGAGVGATRIATATECASRPSIAGADAMAPCK
jgi:hypothetical protein